MKLLSITLASCLAVHAAAPNQSLRQLVGMASSCAVDCAKNCATCSSRVVDGATAKVTVSLANCKGGATMSWMCCRSDGCTRDSCDGTEASSGSKCDEVTQATYSVSSTATAITVQIHDGKMGGDVDCSVSGRCCGGSGSSCADSGVCDQVIDLTTCPVSTPTSTPTPTPECSVDSDCADPNNYVCGEPKCSSGVCSVAFKPSSTVCRASAGVCDVSETCTGSSYDCPTDGFLPTTQVCRGAAGVCDVEETCSGSSASCPTDIFAPTTTVCRESAGVCDVEETCSGSTASCPTDIFAPATTECRGAAGVCDAAETCTGSTATCPTDLFLPATEVCRGAAGVCDVEETCSGSAASCPVDGFQPSSTVCRAAVVAPDGTSCDVDEKCSGGAATCPTDVFASAGMSCRPNADPCDVPETCTGARDCPANYRNDNSYTYKCANTCYLCGVDQSELSIVTYSPKGNAYKLGDVGIGQCQTFVDLNWPSCTNQCINSVCANNRGLSNAAFFQCHQTDGAWMSTGKVEVSDATVFPVCPTWATLLSLKASSDNTSGKSNSVVSTEVVATNAVLVTLGSVGVLVAVVFAVVHTLKRKPATEYADMYAIKSPVNA